MSVKRSMLRRGARFPFAILLLAGCVDGTPLLDSRRQSLDLAGQREATALDGTPRDATDSAGASDVRPGDSVIGDRPVDRVVGESLARDGVRVDAPAGDAVSLDRTPTDGPASRDTLAPDVFRDTLALDVAPADGVLTCTTHCECPQGSFCYRKTCRSDPKAPVYCCDKKDALGKDTCPPGRWCVERTGAKSTCAESKTFACRDACDCGPAHCCVNGNCVKDQADPWIPGAGRPGTSTPVGMCTQGTDATYCCDKAECHAAHLAYGVALDANRMSALLEESRVVENPARYRLTARHR